MVVDKLSIVAGEGGDKRHRRDCFGRIQKSAQKNIGSANKDTLNLHMWHNCCTFAGKLKI